MKKKLFLVVVMVVMMFSLTGCFHKKPLKVTNTYTILVNGEAIEEESVFYILDGQIVDENGNPVEE